MLDEGRAGGMNPEAGHFGSFKAFMRNFRGKRPVKRHILFWGQGINPPPLGTHLVNIKGCTKIRSAKVGGCSRAGFNESSIKSTYLFTKFVSNSHLSLFILSSPFPVSCAAHGRDIYVLIFSGRYFNWNQSDWQENRRLDLNDYSPINP